MKRLNRLNPGELQATNYREIEPEQFPHRYARDRGIVAALAGLIYLLLFASALMFWGGLISSALQCHARSEDVRR